MAVDAIDQPRCQQGMSADLEEIIKNIDGFQVQKILPYQGQSLFNWIARHMGDPAFGFGCHGSQRFTVDFSIWVEGYIIH